eukprot:SAG22_NODE_582_length_8879_cov_2.731663_6_plen_987_part_00
MKVGELLRHGANPSALDPETHGTALMIAATVGQAYVIQLLLDAGAQVDQTHPDFGMTPLLWACNNAHVKCVELLIEAGADKKATEVSGLDGRELATENMRLGWERVVDLLTDIDSDGNSSDDQQNFAAERAMSAARTKRMQKIVGDNADENALQFLQTSEQMDKGPATTNTKPLSVLQSMQQDRMNSSIDDLVNEKSKAVEAKPKSLNKLMLKGLEIAKDEQDTNRYLEHWGANEEVKKMVVDFLKQAKSKDKSVTPMLNKLVVEHSGNMYGLDFRVKSMASLARKVLEKSKGVADAVEATLKKQNDALRYTVLFGADVYVTGVKAVEAALTAAGISRVKMKNFWRKPGESADYMGINAIYRTEDGFPFEVQYHTAESIDTKMQRCHHSYEKFREDHSMAKAQYWEDMVRMWSLVPVPPGVLELGTLVVHKVDIDDVLVGLSAEERAVLEGQKKLEDVVMPKCEAVTGQALTAEAKVTPILVATAEQHGIQLHGLDFRVKSGLSMARKVVATLHEQQKTHTDLEAIEATIWVEQRQALRYTLVCNAETYVQDVRAAFLSLNGAGFTEEFVWNYWRDTEPYNVIRSRLWSENLQTWCFVVFHTVDSLELSEARLGHYQRSIGMVFHTATFQEKDLEKAVEDLNKDQDWAVRVKSLHIPKGAETVGKQIQTGRSGDLDALAKPSASLAQRNQAAEVNKVFVTVLGLEIAQLLAEAALAEDTGRMRTAVDTFDSATALLKELLEDSSISTKKRNIAAGELYACETSARKLKKQINSRSGIGATRANAVAALANGSTSAMVGGVTSAGKVLGTSARLGAAGAQSAFNAAKGIGSLGIAGSRAIRHNVLADNLSASTRRFMTMPTSFIKSVPVDEEQLKVVWEMIDENADGSLDKDELAECFELMGKVMSEKRLEREFRVMDKDKNGTIEYNEFLAWWKKQDAADRMALEKDAAAAAALAELEEKTAEDTVDFSNPLDTVEEETLPQDRIS